MQEGEVVFKPQTWDTTNYAITIWLSIEPNYTIFWEIHISEEKKKGLTCGISYGTNNLKPTSTTKQETFFFLSWC